MIELLWLVLGLVLCGGIYGVGRILARDDMPLTRAKIKFAGSIDLPSWGCSAAAPGFRAPAGEPVPGGGGSARSGSAAGQSAYQVLYAMATAVNDAWLDRLFAGTGAE